MVFKNVEESSMNKKMNLKDHYNVESLNSAGQKQSESDEKFESECEKNDCLYMLRDDLLKQLDKKTKQLENLETQYEDEKSFYAAEIDTFKKETNLPEQIISNKSQTDVSNQPSLLSIDDYNRIKYNIDEQKETALSKNEQNLELQKAIHRLEEKMSQVIEKYRCYMSDLLLKNGKCRFDSILVLDHEIMTAEQEELLKIVKKSNRLFSENLILKQEILHMSLQMKLMDSRNDSKRLVMADQEMGYALKGCGSGKSSKTSVISQVGRAILEISSSSSSFSSTEPLSRRVSEDLQGKREKNVAILDDSDDSDDMAKSISAESSLTVIHLFPPIEPVVECNEWSTSVLGN